MTIGPEQVRHVARLAELAVGDDDVNRLAEELQAIVSFVEQLGELRIDEPTAAVVVGPTSVTLREDVVNPIPMVRGAADLAPAFEEGFFVVPKLGGLAEE